MKKRIMAVAGLAMALASQQAMAQRLIVFGDSLVDSGNAYAVAPQTANPANGYFPGRYSNGYNFADYLAGGSRNPTSFTPLGGARAAVAGGTNFSVGGAATAEVRGDQSPSFLEQIATFRSLAEATTPGTYFTASDQVLLTFGGNDIQTQLGLAAVGVQYDAVTAATNALRAGLRELVALGARNILVTGQADVGDIPKIRQLAATSPLLANLPQVGTDLSRELNSKFGYIAKITGQETGADISFFNLFAFEQSIVADPAGYGLTDLDNPCQTNGLSYLNQPCAGSLYFDKIHPTTYAHGLIADGITSGRFATVPEPASWAMLIGGFAFVGGALRRRRPAVRARVTFA